MNTTDLLLEIGCEEIPTSYILPALDDMKRIFTDFCASRRIDFESAETYATPRRLTIIARGVALKQKDEVLEIKGPPAAAAVAPDGKFTQAAEKFAASRGVTLKDLSVRDTDKGKYLFAVKKEKGVATEKTLPDLLKTIITKIEFPKTMRWASYKTRFARPIRWVLFLFGEKAIKVELDGVTSGRATRGHRFTHNKKLNVPSPADYFTILEENHVMADHNKRRKHIEEAVRAAAGGAPLISEKLLNDVLFLVEYPHVGIGAFDEKYLRLPREVLILTTEKNQHYFPVEDEKTGKLLNRFCVVMNVALENSPVVLAGYEKVLLSRLQDALFFYENDLKKTLEERIPALDKITFQKALGSIGDKARRLASLTARLADTFSCTEARKAPAVRAAQLCKTDLTSSLVFEYTDLQGTAGKYYFSEEHPDGDAAIQETAAAIEEHYKPRFADDDLPCTVAGTLLALADKTDTICGYFSVGLIPSGSEDPFQLRRQALGVLRIMERADKPVKLETLLETAIDNYGSTIIPEEKRPGLMKQLLDFFDTRQRIYMESRGFTYDVVNAVDFRALPGVRNAFLCASAIAAMRDKEAFQNLLEVYTRISNIMSKSATGEDFKGNTVNGELLKEPQEQELFVGIKSLDASWVGEPSDIDAYKLRINDLFSLTALAHDFFDKVLVMAEDPAVRSNRLSMLSQAKDLYTRVADFARIVKS